MQLVAVSLSGAKAEILMVIRWKSLKQSVVELTSVTLIIVGVGEGELMCVFGSVVMVVSGLVFGSVIMVMVAVYQMWERKKILERLVCSNTI